MNFETDSEAEREDRRLMEARSTQRGRTFTLQNAFDHEPGCKAPDYSACTCYEIVKQQLADSAAREAELAGNRCVPSITSGGTEPYSEELPDGPCIFPSNPNDLVEIASLKAERDQLAAEVERLKTQFEEHTKAVGAFLDEMYGIMVDPLADEVRTVTSTTGALRQAALWQRQHLADQENQLADHAERWQKVREGITDLLNSSGGFVYYEGVAAALCVLDSLSVPQPQGDAEHIDESSGPVL